MKNFKVCTAQDFAIISYVSQSLDPMHRNSNLPQLKKKPAARDISNLESHVTKIQTNVEWPSCIP